MPHRILLGTRKTRLVRDFSSELCGMFFCKLGRDNVPNAFAFVLSVDRIVVSRSSFYFPSFSKDIKCIVFISGEEFFCQSLFT